MAKTPITIKLSNYTLRLLAEIDAEAFRTGNRTRTIEILATRAHAEIFGYSGNAAARREAISKWLPYVDEETPTEE